MDTGSKYKSCCGKDICSGCIHAITLRSNGVSLCPFCRTTTPDSEKEILKRTKKRAEAGDATAMYTLGYYYSNGSYGLTRDRTKSLELWHKAGELGHAKAYVNIGHAYHNGEGVERDEKKTEHYFELAAMKGDEQARHNLGSLEARAGNWDRALKHYMFAVGGGYSGSVKMIQQLYKLGHATKDDYANALRAYQSYLDEIRSEQRDMAAAFSLEEYKYIE
jgi:TPR repeat protein